MSIVKNTIYLSLTIQILSFLIGMYRLSLPIPSYGNILKEVMKIENVVQFIEIVFYIWFGFFVSLNLNKVDMAKYRYYDWFFTTPIMLLSTMLYFDYTDREKSAMRETYCDACGDNEGESDFSLT